MKRACGDVQSEHTQCSNCKKEKPKSLSQPTKLRSLWPYKAIKPGSFRGWESRSPLLWQDDTSVGADMAAVNDIVWVLLELVGNDRGQPKVIDLDNTACKIRVLCSRKSISL